MLYQEARFLTAAGHLPQLTCAALLVHFLVSLTVWTGTPNLDGHFFHQTVPASEICTRIGLSWSDSLNLPSPTFSRSTLCNVWYPEGVLEQFSPCDSEPYVLEVTCSAFCGFQCDKCSTASVCEQCASGFYVSEDGTCVLSSACGDGFYASATTGTCERKWLCESVCL